MDEFLLIELHGGTKCLEHMENIPFTTKGRETAMMTSCIYILLYNIHYGVSIQNRIFLLHTTHLDLKLI